LRTLVVDDPEMNPRQSIKFLSLRAEPFTGECIFNQPTAIVVAKSHDMSHCGLHDITRHYAAPRALSMRTLQ